MNKYIISEVKDKRYFVSKNYNSVFNKKTGFLARWGNTLEDDPDYSVFGPEILDIEISAGKCSQKCKFCYKSNGAGETRNMTLDQFKLISKSFPKTLTQIAFGITDITENPDFWDIMSYTRSIGVIPNYTTNGYGVTEEVAKKTSELCGAVAVSLYDKDMCFNAIEKFTKAGMTQVNIHFMLCEETIKEAINLVFYDVQDDDRLKDLNAVVFLQYKPHGRGIGKFTPIQDVNRFRDLIDIARLNNIGIGFDSCTAPLYFKAIENLPEYKQLSQYAEPCESGLFSYYLNVEGKYFPCSFTEGEKGWEEGIDGNNSDPKHFIQNIWFNPRMVEWRNNLIKSSAGCDCKSSNICRNCPVFNITSCKKPELINLEILSTQ